MAQSPKPRLAGPVISLHDRVVDSIRITDDKVTFIFSSGIVVSHAEQRSEYAEVECEVGMDLFDCYLVHRYAFLGKFHFYGHEISLTDVSGLLEKGMYLELIDEYYTPNHLYWRFCLHRKKRLRRLYDELIIECDVPSELVHFRWEGFDGAK